MKRRSEMAVCAAALTALALSSSLWAVDGTWLYREGVGTAVTNLADWADPANWVDGIVATGKNSLATFGGTATTWVSIPDGYWIGSVKVNGNQEYTTFLGKTINMSDTTSGTWKSARFYGTSANVNLLRVWADKIKVEGVFSPSAVVICAPFEADSYALSYSSPLRRDWFATSSDENVSNIWNASAWTLQSYSPVYVPGQKSASTGYWVVSEGENLARYVSGTKGLSLAPGQTVAAEGFLSPGTFVKRIYSDAFIELSSPALASSSEDGVEMSFGAFSIKLWQDIPSLAFGSSDQVGYGLLLQRGDANVSLVFDVQKVTGNPTFYTYDSNPSGLLSIHDVSRIGNVYARGYSTVQFAGTNDVCDMTIPKVYFLQAAGYTRLDTFTVDVPEGRSLTIDSIALNSGVTYSLTTATISKTGDGTLTVVNNGTESPKIVCGGGEFVYDVSGCAAEMSLPSVTVNGGTFEPVIGANGAIASQITVAAGAVYRYTQNNAAMEIGTLQFKSGAILEIAEGAVFYSSNAVFAGDVTIRGPGKVVAGGGWTNCSLVDGATMVVEPIDGARLTSEPVPEVVGHPAFWVDACDFTNETIAAECVENGEIKRWNDHRPDEVAVYAYKDGVRPTLVSSATRGLPAVKFVRVEGAPTDATLGNYRCMLWNVPISGIRAVFLVEAPSSVITPGGCVLGSTPGFGSIDFCRDRIATPASPLVASSAAECVRNGDSYVWGMLGKPTVQDFNCYSGVQIVELHPLVPGGRANAFAINGNANHGSGAMSICECIVYTNALTYAERVQVAQYLHKKWVSPTTSVYYEETAPRANMGAVALSTTTGGVEVTENAFMEISSLEGEGAFVKDGAGELYVSDAVNASAHLAVVAGTARIRSYSPTTNDFPSAKPIIRLDATATNTLLLGSASAEMPVGDATTRADRWLDAEGGIYRASPRYSDYPNWYLKNEGPLGQPVVDLGPMIVTNNNWVLPTSKRFMMQISESPGRNGGGITVTNVASAFMVWGSKYGGNRLLGNFNVNHGIFRKLLANADTTVADWIAAPIYGGNPFNYADDTRVSKQTEWRKNGEAINPYTTGLSGTWDMVSYLTPYRGMSEFDFSALGFSGAAGLSGGMQIGEFIAYTSTVTRTEYRIIDAYLNKKWFNRDLPGYRPAMLGSVDVAAGATLEVDGNAPIMCSTLKGAGTVNGAIDLAAGAVFEAPVGAGGTIAGPLTVSGAVDMSKGGVILLTGQESALVNGEYHLIASSEVSGGDWAVNGYTGKRVLTLRKRSDGIWLYVSRRGLNISIR